MFDLIQLHKKEYGCSPEIIGSAPGVLNLMGEHTDYNEGFVLQMALEKRAALGISKRTDNSLKFFSSNFGERKRTTIPNLKYRRDDRWANYSKGVLQGFLERGLDFTGLDITIDSTIPMKIGLGSSAGICTATATAMNVLFRFGLGDMELAQIAAHAEREFMGLNRTITDPLVSCLGRPDTALCLDLRTLNYDHVPLKLGDYRLLLTDSHVPSVVEEEDLAEFQKECARCVEYLSRRWPGSALRDYSPGDFGGGMGLMPEASRRFCSHVVEENLRVQDARKHLMVNDLVGFGKIMNRSHESLRDNYEVSCPEIDWLVKRAWEIDGVLGSRMTGLGFGGCTLTLLTDSAWPAYEARLKEYEHIFGFSPRTFYNRPGSGVETETLK